MIRKVPSARCRLNPGRTRDDLARDVRGSIRAAVERFPRSVFLLLVSLLGGPSMIEAQLATPDPTVLRLAWGRVNVLVRADTMRGIHVWAQTSGLAPKTPRLAFVGYFDPQAVWAWLGAAGDVLAASSVPSDSAVGLQTPALHARDGSTLVLRRGRKGEKWENEATIFLIDAQRTRPWSITIRRDQGGELLQALVTQAGRSRVVDEPTPVSESNPLDTASSPTPLPGNPFPEYPAKLRRLGQQGEVWLSFVVQADGRAKPSSFLVLLSDDVTFSEAVITSVLASRYRPGTRAGQPMDARVYQHYTFTLR
jgi:TonB family protein